jgi:hypothetical protein
MRNPAKAFVDWAKGAEEWAEANGHKLDLIILHEDAENDLLAAIVREGLPNEDARIVERTKRYGRAALFLSKTQVMFSPRVPKGQAWFRYAGQKAVQEEKEAM